MIEEEERVKLREGLGRMMEREIRMEKRFDGLKGKVILETVSLEE